MNNCFQILLSPWMILLGAAMGIITGTKAVWAVPLIKPIGDIYLAVLQMCVIPIMAAAILSSIGRLVKSNAASKSIARLVKIFLLMFVVTSIISIAISMASKPYILSDSTKKAMGTIVVQTDQNSGKSGANTLIKEIDSRHYEKKVESNKLLDFITNMIPRNIFYSLAQGENLKIIFFFIVLGIMMKFIPPNTSEAILTLCDGVYQSFQKVIKMLMYGLPFGLWSLLANQFASTGFAMVSSLISLVVLVYVVLLILFIAFTIILWLRTGGSYLSQFTYFSDVILLCLGTRNSFAAIPGSITGTSRMLSTDDERIGLTIPIGVTLCRYGNVAVFSLGAVFAMQLYNFAITPESFAMIIITSSLASMATSGTPGIVSRTMIGMVLAPLGIPAEAIIIILIALDPVIDPIITLINVFPSCVAAALITGRQERPQAAALQSSL